ncbi:YMGG-like glycine zipper-containing protein [uncultured Hoeflea sp.]|uniref:YMGG-like glycine zipper-containing protein n=1 Tax=uncultured Hoeflea sp. TaxID=538666 RepID=UPI00260EB4F8|nr:YMGG-like glycine zipper-containing protein [uncultured Hoeflea sp.]
MKKIVISTFAAVSLLAAAGCSTTEQRAVGGAAVGAGTGALIAAATGSSSRGVATGALIGGAAGALIGAATTPGMCRYRDAQGRIYEARC